MTVKTTLGFTDHHHGFLANQMGQGVFALQSAAVAARQARSHRLIIQPEPRPKPLPSALALSVAIAVLGHLIGVAR